MRAAAILTLGAGLAAVSAADCAAPGAYDGQGRYSCNPAHQYPNGQRCTTVDGCPLLVDASGQPIVKSTGTSSTVAGAQPTSTCVAPAPTIARAAHQYPNGQRCVTIDGCPLLADANGQPIVKGGSTGTSSAAQPTSTCVAGGSYDAKGRYSCNPAHQYPNGQTCISIDGCPLLADANGQPIVNGGSTSSAAAQPSSTNPACAAPGEYDGQGRYSCNPAHRYPDGQLCKVTDGCPLLCGADGKPIVRAGNNTSAGTNGQPTAGVPIVTNGGSVLAGAMALVAAALAAVI
ncbi:hypothetical protein CCM_06802 [Cordyceps militaris CM01]|uniref:Secreted protein n=1 Tax=Cordyceps militaris (strain CM01) TaxID=983644 RepID=G3JL08_CORMM|nr:uncharacterized protein CCM_06802 [Cordyceps militaris CM01]EGX90382.1 hypothetical protein CCM_06802 [Cordyceps militaris CM01]